MYPSVMLKAGLLAGAACLIGVIAFGSWYFRSGATRPTLVPHVAMASSAKLALPAAPRSIIVIVEENKSYQEIFGNQAAVDPYVRALAAHAALFTQSYGIAHPSQPNYLSLFAGIPDTNGDACPARGFSRNAENLESELLAAHRTFRAYVDDLPHAGFLGCSDGQYARKHAPWTNFSRVPAANAVPLDTLTSYDALPDVAFVIPNLAHDMHSASIASGDAWLHDRMGPLIAWAQQHNTLVILTWDESNAIVTNHIPTLFVGPMVKPGRYGEVISHYRVLRTIEDLMQLPHAGHSADVAPIADCWQTPAS